ncbi:MAG: ParB/RepB/Spo0J family partition protein [Candidatus Loosdrechtia sp.]|uniref:ParB/RepB/Spo0J family partition protein n=1 Tax=Candidatus Loosdrechtia sp. TaxID=3101272 RepID=UPI003A6A12E7|nr:MAG: ParB/RepB/Spo0J family partition protein [Candidatus Jettenia sp. AMX2]
MSKKEKLSRSLQTLLGGVIGIEDVMQQGRETGRSDIIKLNPHDIKPNNHQPRDAFHEKEMHGLVESIKKYGILQPIIVRPVSEGYMLIAGERRWRAAKQIGLKEIPAVVREADELNNLEIALIENIQREDLNPIEKAAGFQRLINEFGLTQEQVAKAMGKDRSSVTNYIRLLDLPREIQDNVSRGTISMGHARALLSLREKEKQLSLSGRIIKEGLSVREVETIVSLEKVEKNSNTATPKKRMHPQVEDMEDRFRRFFGTKVSIKERNGKGKITITFNNNEEFCRIANTLGVHL